MILLKNKDVAPDIVAIENEILQEIAGKLHITLRPLKGQGYLVDEHQKLIENLVKIREAL